MTAAVRSMTGFGTAEAEVGSTRLRIEIRSVNHRFLDLKVRLPRDLQSLESQFRSLVQSRFNRGALELKLERTGADTTTESAEPVLEIHEARAREVLHVYQQLAKILGSTESPTLRDIALFPDVIRSRGAEDLDLQKTWKERLEPAMTIALNHLLQMRETEGANLARILLDAIQGLRTTIHEISRMRQASEAEFKRKITERVELVFQTHPLPALPSGESAAMARAFLESRIAQELALVIDRTDIQEELHRFEGHLAHFEKTMAEGGAVGRKLEFILQELGREINTLGNKAQDFGISEQVVSVKVRLEQLREQVLNLE